MGIRIEKVSYFVLDMKTRMPFRYGIARMEALPHVMLEATVWIDGVRTRGVSAEGLAPRWFTKDPDQSLAEERARMIDVLKMAADRACRLGEWDSPFAFWQALERDVKNVAPALPGLLRGLGVSMVERAMIDAFCRHARTPFHKALRENALGVDLGAFYPDLAGIMPGALLPKSPRNTIFARHTVGLSDPLFANDIRPEDRLRDGLPQALEEAVSAYGLTYAKVKVSGDTQKDEARLDDVLGIFEDACGKRFRFTLDGNEFFFDRDTFVRYCKRLCYASALAKHRDRLLFFEQPFHRSVALAIDVAGVRREMPWEMSFIIDESDAEPEALTQALERGYSGTSHKNCKGVFKSIANACRLAWLNDRRAAEAYILSSEDLATVGPVALLQDLAVAGALGILHSERNGHHYFRGLSMFPDVMQRDLLAHHDTLYDLHEDGYPVLRIQEGQIALETINSAPFGYGFDLQPAILGKLDEWTR